MSTGKVFGSVEKRMIRWNRPVTPFWIGVGSFLWMWVLLFGCRSEVGSESDGTDGQTPGDTATDDPGTDDAGQSSAKFVFLLIGDGMAAAQILAAERYLASAQGIATGSALLTMTSDLVFRGTVATASANMEVTDSAAAATAMATGQKTDNGNLSVSADGEEQFVTIAQEARDAGRKVGIITSDAITQATPGAFYAHVSSRGQTFDIAQFLFSSGFDYFAGGGFDIAEWPGEDASERRSTLDSFLATAVDYGYRVAEGRLDIENSAAVPERLMAINGVLQPSGALPFDMDRDRRPGNNDVSLLEFVQVGIERFEGHPEGFFMMIESSNIDWGGHDNDGAALVHEMLHFDQVVDQVLAFHARYPEETLVVLTGDHECGGLERNAAAVEGFSYHEIIDSPAMSGRRYMRHLQDNRSRYVDCTEVLDEIRQIFGFDLDGTGEGLPVTAVERAEIETACEGWLASADNSFLYFPLARQCVDIVNRLSGLNFTTIYHTAVEVPLYAIGTQASLFEGSLDNTDIYHLLKQAMGL